MLQKNEHYEMTIDDFGSEGEGVGRIDGFAVFVPGAIPRDRIEVRIVKVKRSFAYGKCMRVIQPSADRADPPCPLFGRCGGCGLLHCRYEAQLAYKRKKIADCLTKLGGVENLPPVEMKGTDKPYGYRNKVLFPVAAGRDGGVQIGFYARRSHNLFPVEDCCLYHPVNREVVRAVKTFAEEYRIQPYNEAEHRGLLRHIYTRVSFATGEVMVVLVVNGKELPHADVLVAALKAEVPGLSGVLVNRNTERTNTILGAENRLLYGKETITDCIGPYSFEISPHSFFQVNPIQTEMLYRTALNMADIQRGDTVVDAYCGIGTITLFLAEKADKVYGLESVPQAVADARRNAARNGVTNVEFICGEAEGLMMELTEKGLAPDVVLVDPPRRGCGPELLRAIEQVRPGKVVYVSCDPATLGRDVKVLGAAGYRVKEVCGVDMFPMTPHVETVVSLQRRDT